jgi:hypothetical protein
LTTATAASASASPAARSQRSAAPASSCGRAAISVTRLVVTGAGAGEAGFGRRPRSQRRSGAPSVATTSTCSSSPACPRTT